MKHIPLLGMIMFREIFEKKLGKYHPISVNINELEKVYKIEDSLILLVTFEEDDNEELIKQHVVQAIVNKMNLLWDLGICC